MKIEGLTAVSNKIILSRSNFNVPQRRILSAVIETISPFLKDEITKKAGKELSFEPRLDDISRITYKARELSSPEHYNELRKALDELENRKVRIEYFEDEEAVYFGSSLINKFKFKERSETLEVWVDNELYRFLLDLSLGYTLYQTKVVLSLTSIYAMRIYEILAKWRNKRQFYISIEDLRWLTDTQDKFERNNDFKRKVLDIAKQQLDQSNITDLRFDYDEKKRGRKVVGFDIYIYKTSKAHDTPKSKLQQPSLRWDFSKELIENFKKFGLNIKGKNLETVKALKVLLGEKKLAEKLVELHQVAQNKDNPSGYIIASLKNALVDEQLESVGNNEQNHSENSRTKEAIKIGDLLNRNFKN